MSETPQEEDSGLPVGHTDRSEREPPELPAPATSSAPVTKEEGDSLLRSYGHGQSAGLVASSHRLQEIAARAEKATPTDGRYTKRVRYDHGGGRMYLAVPLGVLNEERKLIIDAYDQDDREFYFHALDDVAFLLQLVAKAKGR